MRRYEIKRPWNCIAPILTTNLIDAGVISATANESLTQAAVAAFDRYTNTPSTVGPEVDANATVTNKIRRRRRQSSSGTQLVVDCVSGATTAVKSTANDNFFEYQRRIGYTLDNNQFDDSLRQRLKETHIIEAIIYYMQHFHVMGDSQNEGANCNDMQQQRWTASIVNELQSDSPGITVDLWAAVQRGEGSHHKFHVHEGAVVSGVFYSKCPSGCAPLVLRSPLTDDGAINRDQIINDANKLDDDDGERDDDEIIHPKAGQLVLFPPWLRHGVPLVKEQQLNQSSVCLPRVSWAFNLNVRSAYIGNAWDVTLPSTRY